MKLFIKIFGIIILVIMAILVATPYLFKGRIIEMVKEEINKNVNAQVDFSKVSLSLFRSFPNFNLEIENISISGIEKFQDDTLALVPSIEVTIDLMSVLKGDIYQVKKISINNPVVNLIVAKDGQANWDIAVESDVPDEEEQENIKVENEEGNFVVELRKVKIQNAKLAFNDYSLNTFVLLNGMDFSFKGDFSLGFTSLKTNMLIQELTLNYDGVKYLNKVETELSAVIDADLVNSIYTLRKNELRLNELFLGFDGTIAMLANDDVNLTMTFKAEKTGFKNILSMIPAVYMKDFENVETSGKLALSGNIKGIYNDEHLPSFALNIDVEDGMFKYPDLPKSVENINLKSKINSPGGDVDNIVVNITKFGFTIGRNPVELSLLVKTPVSDPQLSGSLTGEIDLSQISEIYPLEEDDVLQGKITSKVSFNGKMSSIENKKYDEFNALGSVLVQGLKYKTPALPNEVEILKAQLNFAPEYLDLVSFKSKFGNSDLSAKGKITNYLAWIFNKGKLVGRLQTASGYFNVDDIMPARIETAEENIPAPDTVQQNDETGLSVIEIPGDIDFALNSSFEKFIYGNIELTKLRGRMQAKDKVLDLKGLSMELLAGKMTLNGKYDTKNSLKPFVDFSFDLNNINIREAWETFGTMQKLAPIAEKTTGTFSVGMEMKTVLDSTMMPDYNSMSGNGNLKTSAIVIEGVNTIDKLADILKMNDLRKMRLSPLNLSFEFADGKVTVKPFDIKYEDISATISGTTSFDETINYTMKLKIPREKFGSQANAALENLITEANKLGTDFSLGSTVEIDVIIEGTLTDPKVKTSLIGSSGNVMDDLRKIAEEEFNRRKKELEEQAMQELEKKKQEAKAQADKILSDAKKKADRLLKDAKKSVDAIIKTAGKSKEQVKAEAEKQAQALIDEAKKNGAIAEMIAREAADELKKEAFKNADKLIEEAKRKSDEILKAARKNADKILQDAKKNADKLIK